MAIDPTTQATLSAPVLTSVNGTGSNELAYTLAAGETMQIEAIAVDADATAAGDSTISARFLAPSGEVVADSTTRNSIPGGTVCEVTFAPFLPDSADVGTVFGETQLQTGLVLTELPGGARVLIAATDPAVILTGARIWATDSQGAGGDQIPPLEPRYLFPTGGEVQTELV